ncbi:MAG: 1-acylglycerol-3-phosphate O-acyltransferase [Xanthomonadaceae bacterium]|nr:1-acylglycerol-3-phosphate O-acyltransferase [Xanthomonadaceae bacterium]
MEKLKDFLLALYSLILAGILTLFWTTSAIICSFIPPLKVKGINFCARYWGKTILRGSGIKVKVIGAENCQPGKNYMIIANHRSFLDIYAILAYSGLNCRMVAKKELTKIPLFGMMLRRSHTIIIDRGNRNQAIKAMEIKGKELRDFGITMVIFAEGTRATGDKLLGEFKKGAFILAAQLGLPILPITIIGTDKLQPKGSISIHPGTITLKIDPPLEIPEYNRPSDIRPLAAKTQEIIKANLIAAREGKL